MSINWSHLRRRKVHVGILRGIYVQRQSWSHLLCWMMFTILLLAYEPQIQVNSTILFSLLFVTVKGLNTVKYSKVS